MTSSVPGVDEGGGLLPILDRSSVNMALSDTGPDKGDIRVYGIGRVAAMENGKWRWCGLPPFSVHPKSDRVSHRCGIAILGILKRQENISLLGEDDWRESLFAFYR